MSSFHELIHETVVGCSTANRRYRQESTAAEIEAMHGGWMIK